MEAHISIPFFKFLGKFYPFDGNNIELVKKCICEACIALYSRENLSVLSIKTLDTVMYLCLDKFLVIRISHMTACH